MVPNVLCLLLSALPPVVAPPQESAPRPATFFVVRHAERPGKADEITEAGRERAKLLSRFMQTQRVKAVYSTDTNRTVSTATPTAAAAGLKVIRYQETASGRYRPIPTKEWLEQLARRHAGQSVLIVGHSNTVVPIVNGLGGRMRYTVSENEYHSMFIVSVDQQGAQAVRVNFGKVPEKTQEEQPQPGAGR